MGIKAIQPQLQRGRRNWGRRETGDNPQALHLKEPQESWPSKPEVLRSKITPEKHICGRSGCHNDGEAGPVMLDALTCTETPRGLSNVLLDAERADNPLCKHLSPEPNSTAH